MKLDILFLIIGILLLSIPTLYFTHTSITVKEKTGVVIQWNLIDGFGYNIFFKDNTTLFIHDDNPRFTNFLKNLTTNKTYTLKYYTKTYNGPLLSSPTTFNYIISISNENNTLLYEDTTHQKLEAKLTNELNTLVVSGTFFILFGLLIRMNSKEIGGE